MDVIFVLIPASVVLVLLALRALVWAIDSGQFDELDRESRRILFDGVRPRDRTSTEASDEPVEARSHRDDADAPATEDERRATGDRRP